jgi:uncharacterized protein DUF4255
VFQLIDATVQSLLKDQLRIPEPFYIYFLTPDNEFPGPNSLPAINLFLFSIQENRDLRNTSRAAQRSSAGSVTLPKAPVRVDCHYLVTAYSNLSNTSPQSPFDEHQILGETMRVLFRYPDIPSQYWANPAVSVEGLPLYSETALPTTREMGVDLWQSLGQRPRACFHYKVTANMDMQLPGPEYAPVQSVVLTESDG